MYLLGIKSRVGARQAAYLYAFLEIIDD